MSRATLYPQDNIFEWHFAIRGPPDTEFEVRWPACLPSNLRHVHMLLKTLTRTLIAYLGRYAAARLSLHPALLTERLRAPRSLLHLARYQNAAHLMQGGIYHGRILLPPEYPFKPPSFIMLTPNGRFETGVKVRAQAAPLRLFWMVALARVFGPGKQCGLHEQRKPCAAHHHPSHNRCFE